MEAESDFRIFYQIVEEAIFGPQQQKKTLLNVMKDHNI